MEEWYGGENREEGKDPQTKMPEQPAEIRRRNFNEVPSGWRNWLLKKRNDVSSVRTHRAWKGAL
jgi:hypothetical protein